MSPTDSAHLLDSPAASKLGPNRALFSSEEQNRLEKFRPYGLPADEWLDRGPRAIPSRAGGRGTSEFSPSGPPPPADGGRGSDPEQDCGGGFGDDKWGEEPADLAAGILGGMEINVRVARLDIRQLGGQRGAIALGRVPLAAEGPPDARSERGHHGVIGIVVVEGGTEEPPDDGPVDSRPDRRTGMDVRLVRLSFGNRWASAIR